MCKEASEVILHPEFLALERGNPLTCTVYPIPPAPTQGLTLQLIRLSYIINYPF